MSVVAPTPSADVALAVVSPSETFATSELAAISLEDESLDSQPPVIPLPPAVWAGLIGVAGIAARMVKPRKVAARY